MCGGCVNAIAGEVRCPACVWLREQPRLRPLPDSLKRSIAVAWVGVLFPPALVVAMVLTGSWSRRKDEAWDTRAEQLNGITRNLAFTGVLVWLFLIFYGAFSSP